MIFRLLVHISFSISLDLLLPLYKWDTIYWVQLVQYNILIKKFAPWFQNSFLTWRKYSKMYQNVISTIFKLFVHISFWISLDLILPLYKWDTIEWIQLVQYNILKPKFAPCFKKSVLTWRKYNKMCQNVISTIFKLFVHLSFPVSLDLLLPLHKQDTIDWLQLV